MPSQPALKLAVPFLLLVITLPALAQTPPAPAPKPMPPPQILVARRQLDLTPAPAIVDGTLVAPWEPLARAMGARVSWFPNEALLVMVSPAGRRLQVQPGQPLMVDRTPVPLPLAPAVAGGALVGPVKTLVEALDGVLSWDKNGWRALIWGKLLRLETRGDERGVGVTILTSVPVAMALDKMDDPRRSFVDLNGVYVAGQPPVNYANTAGVQRVRCGQYDNSPPVTRLVLDLRDDAPAPKLQPREDGCGGRLVVGDLHGDEPVIERLRPKLLKVLVASLQPETLTITAFLSDPVEPEYDVLRQPFRVLVDLGGAESVPTSMPASPSLPFVDEIRVLDQGRLALHMNELVPFTVKTLVDPDRVQIVFARDHIAGKKIVIDAGHGGKDSGARGSYLLEKDINLDMAKRTVAGLAAMGAHPTITRDADYFVDLYARPHMANDLDADLFVSLHCNATGESWTGSGTGTYYYRLRSKELAVVMHDTLIAGLKTRDYGVHCENFCVTRETNMTAILIETLFIDNKVEEKILDKPEFRQQVANNVCEGIRRYLEGTKSVAPATLVEPQG